MLTEGEGGSDEDLGILHASLDALVGCCIILLGGLKRILLVKIRANPRLAKTDNMLWISDDLGKLIEELVYGQ